jgi:hypothetical protein
MNSNSRFFVGAAILGAGLALKLGAPLVSVILAVAGVGLVNWYGSWRASSTVK